MTTTCSISLLVLHTNTCTHMYVYMGALLYKKILQVFIQVNTSFLMDLVP